MALSKPSQVLAFAAYDGRGDVAVTGTMQDLFSSSSWPSLESAKGHSLLRGSCQDIRSEV